MNTPDNYDTPQELTAFEKRACPVCGCIGRTTYFRLRPESAQAMAQVRDGGDRVTTYDFRKSVKRAVLERRLRWNGQNGETYPWNWNPDERKAYPACVHLLFGLSDSETDKDKDVDNMTKAFLDAIKHVLIDDDAGVQHLLVEKYRLHIPAGGTNAAENVLVGVRIAPIRTGINPIEYQLASLEELPLITG